MRSLLRIPGIARQDLVTKNTVLSTAGIPSMFTLLYQHSLTWLGHIYRMDDSGMPKDPLHGELAKKQRAPILALQRHLQTRHDSLQHRFQYMGSQGSRQNVQKRVARAGLAQREQNIYAKRKKRKESQQKDHSTSDDAPVFTDRACNRICRSRIGLYSHFRRFSSTTSEGAYP